MYQLVYSNEAIEDFEKSILWYLPRSRQAAENFVRELKNKLKIVRYNPHLFNRRYKHFHEVNLYKYPFTIVYVIEESLHRIYVYESIIKKEILKENI